MQNKIGRVRVDGRAGGVCNPKSVSKATGKQSSRRKKRVEDDVQQEACGGCVLYKAAAAHE